MSIGYFLQHFKTLGLQATSLLSTLMQEKVGEWRPHVRKPAANLTSSHPHIWWHKLEENMTLLGALQWRKWDALPKMLPYIFEKLWGDVGKMSYELNSIN